MSQQAFLAEIAGLLGATAIPFMVAGSYASSYHGKPRATNDLHPVIDPTAEQLDAFLSAVGKRYYVSAEAAREALARRSMFNVIDFAAGWKAELIIRKDRPFSVEEFQRRQPANLHGCQLALASAEDVILSKLEWAKITPSERQLQDALNVAVAQWASLDQQYLRKWSLVLAVTDKLDAVLQAAAQAQSP